MNELIEEQIQQIHHFRKFPELKPWIGDQYDSTMHKKLLVVAESHFMPENSTIHHDAVAWYSSNTNILTPDEKDYLNTRMLIQDRSRDAFNSRAHTTFRNIHHALSETGLTSQVDLSGRPFLLGEIALMNYFQRPANTGSSIKDICTPLDKQASFEIFIKVIQSILPDIILFTSTYALASAESFQIWDVLQKQGIALLHTTHPATAHWNRSIQKFEGRTGKQQFIYALKKVPFLHKTL